MTIELDYDGPTSRVTMVWPEKLKELVRDKVGPRGLTEYVIEAVVAKLEGSTGPAAPALTPEPTPVVVAEEPEPKVPENIGEQTREEIIEAALDPDLVEAESEQRQKESEALVIQESPKAKDGSRDDLFARVMARTGGSLEGFENLKLASEIEQPAPKPVEPEEQPAPEPAAPAAEPAPASDLNICPNCGDLLVDGECWSC